jgi:formylglycine-generating enzyme required for sulfatase activity
VGRYEIGGSISETLVQKGKTVITNTNWYNLYKACKSFSKGNVEARMIWGCQWDQVCRFISSAKDENNNTISLDNSRSYGNYSNSDTPANVTGAGSKQSTGFSEYWKTNNIYDLAGNYWEWTQEACYTYGRALRGR